MLAFILLVVLGGGVGLLAVSLAESPKTATDRGTAKRAPEEPDDDLDDDLDDLDKGFDDDLEAGAEAGHTEILPAAPGAMTATSAPMSPPRRTADTRTIPRAYTAIEGRLDEVEPPLWRRALSLVAIVAIAVAAGVGVAAVAAGIIGAMAELLDNAIR